MPILDGLEASRLICAIPETESAAATAAASPSTDGTSTLTTSIARTSTAVGGPTSTFQPFFCPYIIALTANAMVSDREVCFEAGMHNFISKPILISSLKKALQAASLYLMTKRAKKS